MATVGENIRTIRTAAGMSQVSFAEELGVPQSTASRWENDFHEMPDTQSLIRIAKVLGCTVDDLLVGIDPQYDLIRQTSTGALGSRKGETNDAAKARELEAAREAGRQEALAEVRDAAAAFADEINRFAGSKAEAARDGKTNRGGLRRKRS